MSTEIPDQAVLEAAAERFKAAAEKGGPVDAVTVNTKLGKVWVDPEPAMDDVDLAKRFIHKKRKETKEETGEESTFITAKAMICILVTGFENKDVLWPPLEGKTKLGAFEDRFQTAGKFSDPDWARISTATHKAAMGPNKEQMGNSEGQSESRVVSLRDTTAEYAETATK